MAKRLECYLEQLDTCRKERQTAKQIVPICKVIVGDAKEVSEELTFEQKKQIAWARNYLKTNFKLKTNSIRLKLTEMKKFQDDMPIVISKERDLKRICKSIVEIADSCEDDDLNLTPQEKEDIEWARNYLITDNLDIMDLLKQMLAEMNKYREDISNFRLRKKELFSVCRTIEDMVDIVDCLIEENIMNLTPQEKEDVIWAREYIKN